MTDRRQRILYVNGRFLAAPQSGVQRAARRHVLALDALLGEVPRPPRTVLLRPAGAPPLGTARIEEGELDAGGHAFEQRALPRAARGGVLLCLANSAPLLGGPLALMIHDAQVRTTPESYSLPFRAWYRVMQPLAARRAGLVLTVSAYSADELAALGVTPSRPEVVWNGADHVLDTPAAPDALDRLGVRPGGYVLGFASRQPHKNTGLLVEAAKAPGAPPLVLVGGDETHAPAIPAGRVSDAALRALYEGALCLALPSTTEGFGLPAAEAMTLGCPVLAADAGALPEVCAGAARLLPPSEPRAWIEAIRTLEDDPEERSRMIEAGQHRAEALTWRAASEALLAKLHPLLDVG